ncbi:MAG: ABC transporter substrate-binding protein [Candidatus Rokubacteria bacterium]|nr:ABC transporter substrate-binding protein [Candidatus Rokubacteria bacterium]
MARRLIALALLLLAAAGCGNAPRADEPARLVFRHSRMPGERDPLPALLREFERRHPGITVTRESLPWTADVQHQFYVINLEARASGFDVLMLDVIWVPEFARAGWLLDLSDRWPGTARAEHFRSTVHAATEDGRVWAVPWVTNVGLLYYRRDLLARHGLAPPRTEAELAAHASLIRDRERDPKLAGFVWQGKQYEGLVVNVLESLWAAGTDLLGADGALFPDPARAAAALRWRRDLVRSGASPSLVTAADEEISRREFGSGRAVFLRNWPYAIDLFESPESPLRGRVGIAPLPGGGALGGAHLGINRGTRHPDAAWRLVEFLTQPDAQRAIAGAVGLHPTRPSLHAGGVLREIFDTARPRPVTPWYQTISATLQPEFSAAILGVKSPERALEDARHRLDYFTWGPRHGPQTPRRSDRPRRSRGRPRRR